MTMTPHFVKSSSTFSCAWKWPTRQLLLDSCSCTVLLPHIHV